MEVGVKWVECRCHLGDRTPAFKSSWAPGWRSIHTHRYTLDARGTWLDGDFLAVLHKALQVAEDGVPHHRPRLFNGVAFCNEPGQCRNRDYESPFRGRLKYRRILILRHAVFSFVAHFLPSIVRLSRRS